MTPDEQAASRQYETTGEPPQSPSPVHRPPQIDLIRLPAVPDWAASTDPVRAYLDRANIGLLAVGVALGGPAIGALTIIGLSVIIVPS